MTPTNAEEQTNVTEMKPPSQLDREIEVFEYTSSAPGMDVADPPRTKRVRLSATKAKAKAKAKTKTKKKAATKRKTAAKAKPTRSRKVAKARTKAKTKAKAKKKSTTKKTSTKKKVTKVTKRKTTTRAKNNAIRVVHDSADSPAAHRPRDTGEVVRAAIRRVPESGRFGPNKVFIADLYDAVAGEIGMSLPQFKRWLVGANREGVVLLARADTLGEMDDAQVSRSEIRDLGATFHFVLDGGGR